jgi:hypothetical protein
LRFWNQNISLGSSALSTTQAIVETHLKDTPETIDQRKKDYPEANSIKSGQQQLKQDIKEAPRNLMDRFKKAIGSHSNLSPKSPDPQEQFKADSSKSLK